MPDREITMKAEILFLNYVKVINNIMLVEKHIIYYLILRYDVIGESILALIMSICLIVCHHTSFFIYDQQ